jgi:hypothetical protein
MAITSPGAMHLGPPPRQPFAERNVHLGRVREVLAQHPVAHDLHLALDAPFELGPALLPRRRSASSMAAG